MAAITQIRAQNLRTHSDLTIDVSPRATLITGANGSGKTSLIEAVYIAFQGSSFRGGDGDVLAHDRDWYRIDVDFDDASRRTVKFDPSRTSGKKQFVINDRTHYRLPHAQKHPVVLFEPEDLRLLNGSPARRRQFIDRFISQLDPQYALSLRRYERALRQRNTLLKRPGVNDDDLFAWNVSLSEYGAYIIERRQHFIASLNSALGGVYQNIARTEDEVVMDYSYVGRESVKQALLHELHSSVARDMILGYTSSGPHRHDILFTFNGSPALSVASRGEVRTVILALKFLEVDSIEALTGKKPVILLDDVFSELDADRQSTVVKQFTTHQTIVASVGAVDIEGSVIALG